MDLHQQRIERNILYNLAMQIATLLLPLILTPYLARAIGATGVGTYSYTYSVAQYFVLVGTLGTSLYGTRQIAYVKNDTPRLARTFWQVFCLRAVLMTFTIALFLAVFVSSNSPYRTCFLLQSVIILANLVDITWLFAGLEDFKKTVARSISVKVVAFILVLLIVKYPNDVWKYVLIQGGSLLLSNLMLWFCVPLNIFHFRHPLSVKEVYFKQVILLFIPQIAINLYVLFDKTMLGWLTTVAQVGYYDKAEQFAKLPLCLLAVLSTVMLPVMSSLFRERRHEDILNQLNHNLRTILCLGIAAGFGVAAIAEQLVPWLLGDDFIPATLLMVLLAALVPIISISNVIGQQYLIPSNHTKQLTISVTCGACLNFIFNLLLIPRFQAVGACIATLIAEAAVSLIQIWFSRYTLRFPVLLKNGGKYLLSGAVMYFAVHEIGKQLDSSMWTTLLQISIGMLIYTVLLLILQDSEITELLYRIIPKKKR
ncbi:MAG: flippase [Oscillospiraceae bacterium]|nr:flippase [Oscillospiraceae bacterium]